MRDFTRKKMTMTMTKINSTSNRVVRDNITHKCDVIFCTTLRIDGEYYKNNKKEISDTLLLYKKINAELPRYSQRNDSVSILLKHRFNDYEITGFLDERNTQENDKYYSKSRVAGVFCNLQSEIKTHLFEQDEVHGDVSADKDRNTQKFVELLNVLKKLNTTTNDITSNDEGLDWFLSKTTEIRMNVFFVDKKELDTKWKDALFGLSGYNSDSFLLDYVQFHSSRGMVDVKDYIISAINFEETFKLKEVFNNLEKEYSQDKDVSVKLKLNKTFDIKLTRSHDDTEESLMYKAKEILYSNLIESLTDNPMSDDVLAISNKEREVA